MANCTTAANYFHLLRRQAATAQGGSAAAGGDDAQEPAAPPAGVIAAASFSQGGWQPVIEPPGGPADHIRRMVLCSGKIGIDLLTSEQQAQHPEVGIARVEQLAPFPLSEVQRC